MTVVLMDLVESVLQLAIGFTRKEKPSFLAENNVARADKFGTSANLHGQGICSDWAEGEATRILRLLQLEIVRQLDRNLIHFAPAVVKVNVILAIRRRE